MNRLYDFPVSYEPTAVMAALPVEQPPYNTMISPDIIDKYNLKVPDIPTETWQEREARENLAALQAAPVKARDAFQSKPLRQGVKLTPVEGDPFSESYLNPLNVAKNLANSKRSATGMIYDLATDNWLTHSIHSGVTLPRDAISGQVPLRDAEGNFNPKVVERAIDTAGLPAGSVFAGVRSAGSIGVFGGIKAKTADLKKLEIAKTMESAGRFPDEIWTETGWFKANDGHWKFEIPDTKAYFSHRGKETVDTASNPALKLGDQQSVFSHPQLFEAYPQLKDVYLHKNVSEGALGTQYPAFRGEPGGIGLKSQHRPYMQETLLHEIQHHIQDIEGFAKGGTSKQFELTPEKINTRVDYVQRLHTAASLMHEAKYAGISLDDAAKLHRELGLIVSDEAINFAKRALEENTSIEKLRGWADALLNQLELAKRSGYEGYHRLAGEVEARNVAKRSRMTDEELKAIPPAFSQDVPVNLQIVRDQQTPSASASIATAKTFKNQEMNAKLQRVDEIYNELDNLKPSDARYKTLNNELKQISTDLLDIYAARQNQPGLPLLSNTGETGKIIAAAKETFTKAFGREPTEVEINRFVSLLSQSKQNRQNVLASEASEPGKALAASKGLISEDGKRYLRPALKYEGKIYKAPMNGSHQDAIPANLRDTFTRMALSGEDITHFNFGFINHKGHFLDREAALKYGIDEGLLSPHDARYGALTSAIYNNATLPGSAVASGVDRDKKFKLTPVDENPFGE